jgi:flagellar hook assembly protein FlgD
MYGFIVSAEKRGYKIEFYDEKPAPYLADILWAYTSTLFSDIDFTLDPVNAPNSISGTLSDEAGQGISGGFIIAVDAYSGEIVFTYTNNMGQYTLKALKPHYYYLLFMAQGFVPEYFDDVHVWEDATPVLAYGTVNSMDATLTSMYRDILPGIVAGKIYDDQGQGLSGVLVAIQNDQGNILGYDLTDDKGGYEINGIGDGNYQVVATKVNFTSQSSRVDINYGTSEIMIVDFELEQTVLNLPDLGQEVTLPDQIMLMPSYPNPFNPVTNIQFSNPSTQEVRLIIYDILGKRVKELVHETLSAGWHTFKWDARDEKGQQVSSGVYFYALETSEQRFVNKLIFSK